MNYLSVENFTKSFGDRIIFEDLNFGIDQGQKVAIVAKNGNGKSTLLKCLLGIDQPDDGRVVFRNGIRIGYLDQTEELDPSLTIIQEVFNHDLPKLKVVKEYNQALKVNDEDKMASLFEQLSELDAWDTEVKVQQILSKLKFDNVDLPISVLSGGQKKRVALAKVLIAEPDFLILDEPTNHLDLDMIEWLEDYLGTSKSTMLMVTHDRYFLEVVCDSILELEDKTIYTYKGNFSYYLEKKAEREEQLATTVGKARSKMRTELEWMRRQPKARGTKQKARIDSFHDLKKVAKTDISKDELEIGTKMERLGSKILEIHKIGKAYGDKPIINDFSYNFKRKERLGIVGNNGTGKSTFLNLIQGIEELDKGKIVVGETVKFGYYSQENIQVDENKKVIDVIREIAEYIPLEKGREMSASQFLEKFLFSRDMHYNYVYKLSGGEKRRLKLMTILMSNPNFLILDEPTNDLDIFVLNVLEDYLRSFQGCLVVVSHDRYFMDKMVDHLFVFDGSGEIKDIIGNYNAYRKHQKEIKEEAKEEKRQEVKAEKKAEAEEKEAEDKRKLEESQTEKRKLSFKEKSEFEHLDEEIMSLEEEKEKLTAVLSSGIEDSEKLNEASKRLGEVMQIIEDKSARWMELAAFF